MNEIELFRQSLKDFFTPQMLKLALIPLIITFLVMFWLFMGIADYSLANLDQVIIQTQNGQEFSIDPNAPFYYAWAANILTFLLQYSITAWLAGFLLYTVGLYFIMMFSIFTTIIVIGFLTPNIIKILNKRNYPNVHLHGNSSWFSPIYIAIKSLFIMCLLFVLFIPLYFIPIVNIFALNFPIYYFFHKMLNFDVSSTMLNNREYKDIYGRKKGRVRLRTLILYFISMIPFITLFSSVFYIIYLANGYFEERKFMGRKSRPTNILAGR